MPPIRTIRASGGSLPSTRAPVRPPRRRNCQLDAYTRTKLVELKTVAGWTYKQIHTKYPTIPIGTIKTTIARAKDRNQNKTLPRSGRPRKLNKADIQKIDQIIDKDPHILIEDLLNGISNKVKRTSIWRLMHE